MDLTPLYCNIDDFCQIFLPEWKKSLLENKVQQRNRESQMSLSEIMTIVVFFHQSGFRTFKHFFINFISEFHKKDFPDLVSYNRFVELMPSCLIPLCSYLESRKGEHTGIQFVDSTTIKVCHNKRISRNKVFEKLAKIGKSTMGWFYGFKLHLIVSERGDLLAFKLTPGNVDDRKVLPDLSSGILGKLFGDKGYISQELFKKLFANGLHLITSIKSTMKNKFIPIMDKILLRKRSVIETINDQLKNISQIEHSRHRSPFNFMVNLIAGLVAYTHQEKKPHISFDLQNSTGIPFMI